MDLQLRRDQERAQSEANLKAMAGVLAELNINEISSFFVLHEPKIPAFFVPRELKMCSRSQPFFVLHGESLPRPKKSSILCFMNLKYIKRPALMCFGSLTYRAFGFREPQYCGCVKMEPFLLLEVIFGPILSQSL